MLLNLIAPFVPRGDSNIETLLGTPKNRKFILHCSYRGNSLFDRVVFHLCVWFNPLYFPNSIFLYIFSLISRKQFRGVGRLDVYVKEKEESDDEKCFSLSSLSILLRNRWMSVQPLKTLTQVHLHSADKSRRDFENSGITL